MLDWFLPRDGSSSSLARAHLRTLRDRLPPEQLQDAELLVSELVSNAVLHGAGPGLHVTASVGPRELCVGVKDDGKAPLVPREPTGEPGAGGRGLRILDAVASRWGVEQHPDDGKRVWFALSW